MRRNTHSMIRRLAAAPIRLALGLPAFYGMSLKNRCQQIGRWAGLYKGPIHYVVKCQPIGLGVTGRPL